MISDYFNLKRPYFSVSSKISSLKITRALCLGVSLVYLINATLCAYSLLILDSIYTTLLSYLCICELCLGLLAVFTDW